MTLFDNTAQAPADTLSALLNKFAAVTPQNDARITPRDRERCEEMQAAFEAAKTNLSYWENIFTAALDTDEYKGRYSDRTYSHGARSVSLIHEERRMFEDSHFFPGKPLEKIANLKSGLLGSFRTRLIDYFNDTYNLKLGPTAFCWKENTPCQHYSQVVDWIFTQIEGTSLVDTGKQNVISAFRQSIYRTKNVNIEKNKIILHGYKHYFIENYTASWSKEKFCPSAASSLFRAFALWEKDEVDFAHGFAGTAYEEIEFGTLYAVYRSNRIEGIKLFKNGKAVVSFLSPTDAQSFFDFFGLSTLKDGE